MPLADRTTHGPLPPGGRLAGMIEDVPAPAHVRLEGVSRHFGAGESLVEVLHDVSFSVARGARCCERSTGACFAGCGPASVAPSRRCRPGPATRQRKPPWVFQR